MQDAAHSIRQHLGVQIMQRILNAGRFLHGVTRKHLSCDTTDSGQLGVGELRAKQMDGMSKAMKNAYCYQAGVNIQPDNAGLLET
eukprot:scaffold571020_cov21-Prasinocladus_malaysianus.AAC.1